MNAIYNLKHPGNYDQEASDLHYLAENMRDHLENPNREMNGIPTAIFHGFGDACINPGFQNLNNEIEAGTGAPVHCIEVGAPSIGEVFNNFETIAEKSCSQVASNPDF